MGGTGGGGRSLRPEELRELERVARDSLKEAAQPQKRNVFISFAEEDLGNVNLLRGQAKMEDSAIDFNDWSLKKPFDSENAEYIRRGIRERIRQSSVTICYLSENTARSKWVDWEIRETIKLGKSVVAMYQGERPPTRLPPAITELRISLVPWSHDALSMAIDKSARKRD